MRAVAILALAGLLTAGDGDYEALDQHAILGVRMSPPSPAVQMVNRTSAHVGVEVREVLPGTAAEAMGLEPGDLILSVNGGEVQLMLDLRNEVALSGVGGPVALEIRRDGRDLSVAGILGSWPPHVPVEQLDTTAEIAFRNWQRGRWQRIENDVTGLARAVEDLERSAETPAEPLAAAAAAALQAMPALHVRLFLAVDAVDKGDVAPGRVVAWDARVLLGVPRKPTIH